jgi:hypothetical protein
MISRKCIGHGRWGATAETEIDATVGWPSDQSQWPEALAVTVAAIE